LRIIFMGTPDFAVPTLRALHGAGHEIALVVAQPDRPVGRGHKVQSPPVIEAARALGLPTAQPKALRSGPFPERFIAARADVAVVIAYGRLLPQALLDAPRHGCVNLHASLLPRWRGAAPIQAAILAGDAETGVCAQRMVLALDEGPILARAAVAIGPRETAGELHDRLSELSAAVALDAIGAVAAGSPAPQLGEPSYAAKIDRESGRIDWAEPAAAIDRRVRAMTPWPGGHVPWSGGPLKILSARPVDGAGPPGSVLATAPELVVACGAGALALERVCAPGRRPVSGSDLANGAHLAVGAPLSPQE
jgi:methionyl-tRNA formyltransferase